MLRLYPGPTTASLTGVRKPARHLSILALAVAAMIPVVSAPEPARAARSIEQAASALLEEVLPVLGIEITNADLLEELGYEIQYSIDALIIRTETIDDLDLEMLDEELPDEDLFGDEQGDETIDLEDDSAFIEESDDAATDDTTAPATPEPLGEQLSATLRERFRAHLSAQTAYWAIVSSSWNSAGTTAASTLEECVSTAQSDEDEDICYFNELQTLQFLFAQQLADNMVVHDQAAIQAGTDATSLLSESRERMFLALSEIAEFLSDEEIGQFGATREAITQIVSVLATAANDSDGGQ